MTSGTLCISFFFVVCCTIASISMYSCSNYVLQRKLENEIKGFDDVYKAKKRTCLEDSEKFRRELKRVRPRSKLAPLALMKFILLSVAP